MWWWPWRGTWTHTYRPSWQWAGRDEGSRVCPGQTTESHMFMTSRSNQTSPSDCYLLEQQLCQRLNQMQGFPQSRPLPRHSCRYCLWVTQLKLEPRNNNKKTHTLQNQVSITMRTHKSCLAFLLHEEKLSPVSCCCFHAEHHQVAQRQHPKKWGEEELTQGALTVAWWGGKEQTVFTSLTFLTD